MEVDDQAARHETEDAMSEVLRGVGRSEDAKNRSATRAQNVALAVARIGPAREEYSHRRRVCGFSFRLHDSIRETTNHSVRPP